MIRFLLFIMLSTCTTVFSQQQKTVANTANTGVYTLVGKNFDPGEILSSIQMQENYEGLKEGDTIDVSYTGKVASVCQSKGCWLTMNLKNGKEVMVKFKDYAFFVPKDISGKEVILNGKAYVTETSVEEQRHYAKDAGKPEAEIAAITGPSLTFSFLADGVKIKK